MSQFPSFTGREVIAMSAIAKYDTQDVVVQLLCFKKSFIS